MSISEDFAIRSMLLRAYAARTKPPKITVVQQGENARPKYEILFPGCHYESKGLD
jgi:hypothetical protein